MNRFADDTDEEIDIVRRASDQLRVPFAVCDGYAKGGDGAAKLAETVILHAERRSRPFTPLYDWSEPIKRKMEKVAKTMYGAGSPGVALR